MTKRTSTGIPLKTFVAAQTLRPQQNLGPKIVDKSITKDSIFLCQGTTDLMYLKTWDCL